MGHNAMKRTPDVSSSYGESHPEYQSEEQETDYLKGLLKDKWQNTNQQDLINNTLLKLNTIIDWLSTREKGERQINPKAPSSS